MKLPRDVPGETLAQVLCGHFGYRVVHQVGSHLVLQTEEPSHHRIAVPAHKDLRVGTLNGILRAVARAKRIQREKIIELL